LLNGRYEKDAFGPESAEARSVRCSSVIEYLNDRPIADQHKAATLTVLNEPIA
jgi:hypothetical protein